MTAFPALNLDAWHETRDTIHIYTRLIGKIRQALAEPHEKWWHVSVQVNEHGFTIPALLFTLDDEQITLILSLNLSAHQLEIVTQNGLTHAIPCQNNSPASMLDEVLGKLSLLGIEPHIDQTIFASTKISPYNPDQASTYLRALQAVHQVFQTFKESLSGKTSPVQFWPHHFDLSLEWFSGRKAAVGEGEAGGDEQIGFGFSTGDEDIPEAYFYANPWPFPKGVTETPLPAGSQWHTASWQGGLLLYNALTKVDNPQETLFNYLQAVHKNASVLMT